MMRVTQLHPVQSDEAPVDRTQQLERIQSSLIIMARAVVQLDQRLERLESQVNRLIHAKEDKGWRAKGESWGRRR